MGYNAPPMNVVLDREPESTPDQMSRRCFYKGMIALGVGAMVVGGWNAFRQKSEKIPDQPEPTPSTPATTTTADRVELSPNEQLNAQIREKARNVAAAIDSKVTTEEMPGRRPDEPRADGLDATVYDLRTSGQKQLQVTVVRQSDGELAGLSVERLTGSALLLDFSSAGDTWRLDIVDQEETFRYGTTETPVPQQLTEMPERFDQYWAGLQAELYTSSPA
jgi:hypothetical protein